MLKALVGSFAALFLSAAAQAEDWPTRPIAIYVGVPAGSGVDVVGCLDRKLVELGNAPCYEMQDQLKATVKRDRVRWAEVVKAVGARVG